MANLLKAICERRDLIWILIERNLKIRYKNSALGFFWTLLGPILLIATYSIFLNLIKFPLPMPFLVVGIICWQFTAMCLGDSLHAVMGNASLITKTAFPRITLPISTILANLINFLLSMAVVMVYLLLARADFGAVYLLPLVMLTQTALCLGLGLLLSASNVFFRDTEHLLSVFMLVWFFLTPVIYPMTMVTERFAPWTHYFFFMNPMTGIVSAYRSVLVSTEMIPAGPTAVSFGIAWLTLAIGIAVFQKAQTYFSDEL